MHYCPQCGSKLLANARFCSECGEQLRQPDDVKKPQARLASTPSYPSMSWGPFAAIFAALAAFGILIAVLIMRQLPARDRLIASAPSAGSSADDREAMPKGHPQVQLPKEALAFIKETEQKARANPGDLAAWDRLGDVALRASAFDSSYDALASEAYAHVLKRSPDDLDALRGAGNIDFDQHKYDDAIAAYEHYLTRKPDDPEVRTDLGTMLLSSGAPDQAILQYKRVIEAHPQFFEAMFNLGVAYGQIDPRKARTTFDQALKLAPDAQTRARVNQMLASLDNTKIAPESGNAQARPEQPTHPADFRAAIEQTMRDLPVAGDKVQVLQWSSDQKVRVLMDNFPMDQMPPFALAKFTDDLKNGIGHAKTEFKIKSAVTIEICDAATGQVMRSVTE